MLALQRELHSRCGDVHVFSSGGSVSGDCRFSKASSRKVRLRARTRAGTRRNALGRRNESLPKRRASPESLAPGQGGRVFFCAATTCHPRSKRRDRPLLLNKRRRAAKKAVAQAGDGQTPEFGQLLLSTGPSKKEDAVASSRPRVLLQGLDALTQCRLVDP